MYEDAPSFRLSYPILGGEHSLLVFTYVVTIPDYLDKPSVIQHSQSDSDIFVGERF